MGKRPLNTTKSGKYMNPADQIRKLARQKELKKNKKQRQLMRLTLVKSQNPRKIINEMDMLDDMEYNLDQKPAYREPVIQDKRKKLREMLDKIIKLYEKDNPISCAEIKKLKRDYDRRRHDRVQYFESIRNTKNVNLDNIPLPESDQLMLNTFYTQPPPPIFNPYGYFNDPSYMASSTPYSDNVYYADWSKSTSDFAPLKSILKTTERSKVVPGPPITDIMPLSPVPNNYKEDDGELMAHESHRLSEKLQKLSPKSRRRRHSSDSNSSDSSSRSRTPSPPSLGTNFEKNYDEPPSLKLDHDYNEEKGTYNDAKEIEDENYEEIIAQDIPQPDQQTKKKIRFQDLGTEDDDDKDTRTKYKMMASMIMAGNHPTPNMFPPFQSYPLYLQPQQQIGFMQPPNQQIPPVPLLLPHEIGPPVYGVQTQIVAAPKIDLTAQKIKDNKPYNEVGEKNIVIQAKPQLRSLTEESLKFMPTSLLVKRNTSALVPHGKSADQQVKALTYDSRKKSNYSGQQEVQARTIIPSNPKSADVFNLKGKDDAYATFMKELEEFL